MPKSKRKRKTALTKTQGKGAQLKMDLVEKIRDSVDKYKFLYVFSYENMRTNMFKKVRQELKDSRLFLGKNKVMQIALGRTEEDEYGDVHFELEKVLKSEIVQEILEFTEDQQQLMRDQLEDVVKSKTMSWANTQKRYEEALT